MQCNLKKNVVSGSMPLLEIQKQSLKKYLYNTKRVKGIKK